MKIDDLAQLLLKLDRYKAPVQPKSNNSPSWEIETTTDNVHAVSEITIMLHDNDLKWDGRGQWNGMYQWGEE